MIQEYKSSDNFDENESKYLDTRNHDDSIQNKVRIIDSIHVTRMGQYTHQEELRVQK